MMTKLGNVARGNAEALRQWLRRRRMPALVLLLYLLMGEAILSPLAHSDMPDTPAQDLANHVSGIIEAARALRERQFPIRVAPGQVGGARYPVFQFYGNFPYTVAGLLHRLHMDPYRAFKVVVLLSLVAGAFATYRCGRLLVRRHAPAAVAGAVFLTAPYILTDLHARMAFTELVSLCLLPVVLYTTLRAFSTRRLSAVVASGIAWALLILTHNVTALYGSLFVGIYVLARTPPTRRGLGRLLRAAAGYGLGLGLAAWYWVPQLVTLPVLLITEVHTNPQGSYWLTPLGELLAPTLVLGCPFPRPQDNPRFGLQVGWPMLAAVVLALCYRFQPGRLGRTLRAHLGPLLILFGVALVGAWAPLDLWDYLPRLFHYIQFSYRLLGFVVLWGALLAACALHACFQGQMRLEHAVGCLCLLGLFAAPYLGPHPSSDKVSVAGELRSPEMGRGGCTGNYRLSAAGRTAAPPAGPEEDFLDMDTTWPNTVHGRVNVYHDILKRPALVQLGVLAYPGLLSVRDNGKPIPHGVRGEMVAVRLPAGEHVVEVEFVGIRWANWVSLLAALGAGVGLVASALRRQRPRRRDAVAVIHFRIRVPQEARRGFCTEVCPESPSPLPPA
jgi:hypothetical protein